MDHEPQRDDVTEPGVRSPGEQSHRQQSQRERGSGGQGPRRHPPHAHPDSTDVPTLAAAPAARLPADPTSDGPAASPERRVSMPPAGSSRTSSVGASRTASAGRFLPGAIIADRYRIVSLLGRGGMGEVYRAEDLRLEQTVALKFLPRDLADEPDWLERMHGEVRLAREIAHRNVSRVYDVGEFEGDRFLSMEFVDGEDLASLLRRIGRVNPEKAAEIGRQLCAGVAAAHERGVLHRDLKPANVMIDGRGAVRIMDFGLAIRSEEGAGEIGTAGTPAYMAPEQWAGRDVTRATDIYALGLILFELFTGRQAARSALANGETTPDAFRRWHTSGSFTDLSSASADLDPTVESVIFRCLERDPRRRPTSALAVSAALPGGDPLAAALAAGETPSPEVVAAAGRVDRMKLALALPLFIAMVLGAALILLLPSPNRPWSSVDLAKRPEVLHDRAEAIAARLGRPTEGAFTAGGFSPNNDLLRWVQREAAPETRGTRLAKDPIPALMYVLRASPSALVADNAYGRVTLDDPPSIVAGMTTVALDPQGRLVRFLAVPAEVVPEFVPDGDTEGPIDAAPRDATVEATLLTLFEEAELDRVAFEPTAPLLRPAVFADRRLAWIERTPVVQDLPRRIEVALLDGAAVSFSIVGPWIRAPDSQRTEASVDRSSATTSSESEPRAAPGSSAERIAGWTTLIVAVVIMGAVLVLAIRHARGGRGDRRGAISIALFVFVVAVLRWSCLTDVSLSPRFVNAFFVSGVALGLFSGALAWSFYMALEPYLRRFWPQSMITWVRLLQGRFRDPLLGRDLLVGSVAGVGLLVVPLLVVHVASLIDASEGGQDAHALAVQPIDSWVTPWLYAFSGVRRSVGLVLLAIQSAVVAPLSLFVTMFLLRIVLRKAWIATLAFGLAHTALFTVMASSPATGAVIGAASSAIILLVMVRFGLVATLGMQFIAVIIAVFPVTSDVSSWYFGVGLQGLVVALALTAWAFWNAVAGTPTPRWMER